jgi:hypothetical protein
MACVFLYLNMSGLEEILTQNISSVVVAGAFIYYLIKKDGSSKQTFDGFNKSLQAFNRTLTNHLTHQLKADVELAKAFVTLSDLIKELIKQERGK